MSQHRVHVSFTLDVQDMEHLQATAHAATTELFERNDARVESAIADNRQQAADYLAQDPRMAVAMVVPQILAHGVDAVLPGASVRDFETKSEPI